MSDVEGRRCGRQRVGLRADVREYEEEGGITWEKDVF